MRSVRVRRGRTGGLKRRPALERLESRALLSTLYVDAQNATGVEDGSQAHPFRTIQKAVDLASGPGADVSVAAGVYAESVRISRPVVLHGPNAGVNPNTATRSAEAVIVPPVDNPGGGFALLVTCDDVTIDGLTLDGANDALGGGVSLNGVESHSASGVTNVDSFGNSFPVRRLVVRDNVIKNFTKFGFVSTTNDYSSPTPLVSTGNVVADNRIDNMPTVDSAPLGTFSQGRGISLEDNFYADVTGNVITRAATAIQAIYQLERGDLAAPAKISGNTVSFYDRGILVYTQDADVPTFVVDGNTVTAEKAGASATNVGLEVDRVLSATSVVVTNNTVNGAHIGLRLGYDTGSPGVRVSGLRVNGGDTGVQVSNDVATGTPGAFAAKLEGVVVTNPAVAGIAVVDALGKSGTTVTLTVDTATTVTGAPHGVTLSGPGARLQDPVAPTVALTTTPPASATSGVATFAFKTADNLTSTNDLVTTYSLDGGAFKSAANPFTLTGLADGTHTLQVRAADQGGSSATTAVYKWTVKTTLTAPPAPTLDTASDTGTSSTDGVTNDNTPKVVGTALPSSLVTVRAGNTVLGSARADAAGRWSLTVGAPGTPVSRLADGTYNLTCTATDSNNRVSPASPATRIVIDTKAPTLTLSAYQMPQGVFDVAGIPLVFSGTANDALSGVGVATYTVTDNSGVPLLTGPVQRAADGSFRMTVFIDPAALAGKTGKGAKDLLVTVNVRDVAGNVKAQTVRTPGL